MKLIFLIVTMFFCTGAAHFFYDEIRGSPNQMAIPEPWWCFFSPCARECVCDGFQCPQGQHCEGVRVPCRGNCCVPECFADNL
uniref:Uncharacterized protein n=1 Tax=Panagrolaimus davidi TaxID=227884 RepID=A0A914QLA7_9BILA